MTSRQWVAISDGAVVVAWGWECGLRLPEGDAGFSTRWRDIKAFVSRRIPAPVNRRGEKSVWQRRFWEYAIRDEP